MSSVILTLQVPKGSRGIPVATTANAELLCHFRQVVLTEAQIRVDMAEDEIEGLLARLELERLHEPEHFKDRMQALMQAARPASELRAEALSAEVRKLFDDAKAVLEVHPQSAAYILSAMSERALAYSKENLAHRFLVLEEAVALDKRFTTYLVRSLLSEGRLRYETVEKTDKGLSPRLIEREGPTGLIATTTAHALDGERETRILTLEGNESPDHMRHALRNWRQPSVGWRSLATGRSKFLTPRGWLSACLGTA